MSYDPNFRGNTAKATLFQSGSANPASTGLVRLAYNEIISWRNDINTANAGIVYRTLAGLPAGFDAFQFLDDTGIPNAALIATNGNNEGFMAAGEFANGPYYLSGSAVVISGNTVDTGFSSSSTAPPNWAHGFRTQTWSNDALGRNVSFLKSRGTPTSPVIVNNGDSIGQISAYGYDGIDFKPAAQIFFNVNNTPGSSNMPGAISFLVTPDSSVTPALAAAINRNKQLALFGNPPANSSSLFVTGAPFTGGSATTTKPLVHIANAATSNNWSTSGTALGINAATGFVGNLIDAQVNAAARFKVDSAGIVTAASRFTSTVTGTNARFTAGTGNPNQTTIPTFVGSIPVGFLTTDNSDGPLSFAGVLYSSASNTDAPSFGGFRARGTFASPAIVQDGDKVAEFYGWGFDGSVFGQCAGIRIEAEGTQSLASNPGRLAILTASGTGPGSQFGLRRASFDSQGNFNLGDYATPASFVQFVPLKAFTLADNQGSAATIYSVTSASYVSLVIEYSVVRGGIVKTGTVRIANDGAIPAIDDQGATTGSIGITFSTTISGGNLLLQYTSTATGSTGTMHFHVRQWA